MLATSAFQHPQRNFEGFPSGFPSSRFNDRFGQPMHQRFQQQPQARASPPPHYQQQHNPRPNADSDRSESIPIKVVHMGHKKHPVGGSPRNTTQLPARGSPKQTAAQAADASPRLERSASEPPKVFNQRLNLRPSSAATIPESGTPPQQASAVRPGLRVPESAHHNLSTSASAPSVPLSQQEQEAAAAAAAAPMPPPRRPSPTKSKQDDQQQQQVRHIPIFVEGRNDPVYSNKMTGGGESAEHRKPSDFYPPGVAKVKPPQRQQAAPQRQEQERPAGLNVGGQRRQPQKQEPTSPEGPPPGPIPMGCSESHLGASRNPAAEPTSPMPVEEGVVIPLPCSPDLYNNQPAAAEESSSVDGGAPQNREEAKKVSNADAAAAATAGEASAPKRKPSKEEIVQGKIEKVQLDVAELAKRIEAFKGDKKDKEYLYLDEMLTRHMLSLDGVETNGNDELRKLRKESIRSINRCLSMLDSRAKEQKDAADTNDIINALAEKSAKMDVEDGGH